MRAFLIAVVVFAFFLSQAVTPIAARASGPSVKAFSTDMTDDGLLSATNTARQQSGKSLLRIDSKLTRSAQAKADDMVKFNYWSHESPDGTQPWAFFHDAGYDYRRAGENLAYGFADSRSTVSAWLNSPSHKENLLGEYEQVGFGIANGNRYQGGQYTVIVAHYGLPAITTATASDQEPVTTAPVGDAPFAMSAASTVTALDQLRAGHASQLLIISLSLIAGAAMMFIVAHRRLVAHAFTTGEKLALQHPSLDAAIIIAITVLILLSQRAAIG